MNFEDAYSPDYYTQWPVERFADLVRHIVIDCLEMVPKKPANESDELFFHELNHYLESEGLLPLEVQEVPEDFSERLLCLLDTANLNRAENLFNSGEDASARLASPQRTLQLGNLMGAVQDYFYRKHPDKAPDEQERIRLWRRDITTNPVTGKRESRLTEVNRLDLDGRVVLRATGVTATHNNLDYMHKVCNHVESMLGGKEINELQLQGDDISIYTLTYPNHGRLHFSQEIQQFNADPAQFSTQAVQQFIGDILLPSLGIEPENDSLPDAAQLKPRMRHVNLYASSYGTTVVQQIRNALYSRLHALGFESQDIAAMLEEVYCLSDGPMNRIDKRYPLPNFSTIYAVTKHDLASRSRSDFQHLVPPDEHAPTLVPINDNTLLIWKNTPLAAIDLDRQRKHQEYADKDAHGYELAARPVATTQQHHHQNVIWHDWIGPAKDNDAALCISHSRPFAYALIGGVVANHMPPDNGLQSVWDVRELRKHNGLQGMLAKDIIHQIRQGKLADQYAEQQGKGYC